MRRRILALTTLLAAVLAVAAVAQAQSVYRYCGPHSCGRAHRLYTIRCGGHTYLSPRPVRVRRGVPCWDQIPAIPVPGP